MAITSNCAEIIITNPQGSVSFNKLITTTELSPAKTIYSEDRVYLIQNSENVPQTFWWNLEKAIADGYADLEELYDYFVAEIANQCGGGGGSSYIPPYLKTGGASWSGTGLVYDVTTLEYYFNGDKLAAATQVTLDASDPDDNRLDAIVVDEAGVVSVIKGDASASPISPSVDESHILVQYILVEAGSTQPTIAKEDIYLENVEWTTSTYTTGTATGSIDFDNAVSPKQGVKCISANADARLGARFVRATSFDPYQYTMLSMWVRFTGSNVATNKSLNVRFENGAGTLVANTLNLFNFGLQRNLLNVWQLVVIPITSFGVLPTSVKGLKIIMIGGTVGVTRQWDMDWILLSDSSVPNVEVPKINFFKDDVTVGSQSGLNLKAGTNIGITAVNDVINNRVEYVVDALGGGGGGGTWGSITGTLSNQTDLQNALNLKYDASNPAGYITSSALSGYLQNNVGIAGGTTLIGGTASGNNLTLVSTSNATKGKILFGTSAYDEVNNRLGIGTTTPANVLSILGNSGTPGGVSFDVKNSNASGDTRFSLSNSSNKSIAVQVTGSSYAASPSLSNGGYLFTSGGLSNMTFLTDGDVISGGSGYISFATGGFLLPTQERMRITSTGNIGIGTTTPHTSAILDLVSITKGLSIPTMNSTSASAIASPKKSLMIYVTDINGTFTSAGWWGYNGTIWKLILAE